jgi:hypothetical protein
MEPRLLHSCWTQFLYIPGRKPVPLARHIVVSKIGMFPECAFSGLVTKVRRPTDLTAPNSNRVNPDVLHGMIWLDTTKICVSYINCHRKPKRKHSAFAMSPVDLDFYLLCEPIYVSLHFFLQLISRQWSLCISRLHIENLPLCGWDAHYTVQCSVILGFEKNVGQS